MLLNTCHWPNHNHPGKSSEYAAGSMATIAGYTLLMLTEREACETA